MQALKNTLFHFFHLYGFWCSAKKKKKKKTALKLDSLTGYEITDSQGEEEVEKK